MTTYRAVKTAVQYSSVVGVSLALVFVYCLGVVMVLKVVCLSNGIPPPTPHTISPLPLHPSPLN